MKHTTSCSVKINGINHMFDETVFVHRRAVAFFVSVCYKNRDLLLSIRSEHGRRNCLEKLCWKTKKNPDPDFSFGDECEAFRKMPSYLRRAAESAALGIWESFESNHLNWETTHQGGEPKLPEHVPQVYPVMYRGNMFRDTADGCSEIKISVKGEWVWVKLNMQKSDLRHLKKVSEGCGVSAPRLVRHGSRWKLVYSIEKEINLENKTVHEQKIAAVDLGVNNAAVVSIMLPDGTLEGRKFISFPRENDRLGKQLGRIKKAQKNGAVSTPRLWGCANGTNHDISMKTAKAVVDYAAEQGCDVIVFECLNTNGKKHGSKKQRLHLWRKSETQKITECLARKAGIRISHVNAYGTSRLAFDGSGRVLRGKEIADGVPYDICLFSTGKVYNCDLNASYNIGARYFVREILKTLPETERLAVQAKVPAYAKRTLCTLSDLISLNQVVYAEAA